MCKYLLEKMTWPPAPWGLAATLRPHPPLLVLPFLQGKGLLVFYQRGSHLVLAPETEGK